MRGYKSTLLLVFVLCVQQVSALEFTPLVSQYNKKDYTAGSQNWSVSQGTDGVIYFGNNSGLLSYDGTEWSLITLPAKTIIRSVYAHTDNRVYVGSYLEFGYFEKDQFGVLTYTSISDKLKQYALHNDEIWNIVALNDTIYFQSFTSYFTYNLKTDEVIGYRCPYTFLFFAPFKGQMYTHTDQLGLSVLSHHSNEVKQVPGGGSVYGMINMLPYSSGAALVVTQSSGLFLYDGSTLTPFKTEVDHFLKHESVNKAIVAPNGVIVIGTIRNGLIAINKQGEKLWELNTSNVLLNNTVLGLSVDADMNLWVAMDKGVAYVKMNNPLRIVKSLQPAVGSIYALDYRPPYLYLGTNQGFYRSKLDLAHNQLSHIELMTPTNSQVWDVCRFGDQLFVCNNEETYEMSANGKMNAIPNIRGGMCMAYGKINGKEVIVQGSYAQLGVYFKENGKWVFSHALDGFTNPIRYIEIDYRGTIWVSHLHHGMYAIHLSDNLREISFVQHFSSLDGINTRTINVFQINNRIVFTDRYGFYTYDDLNKKIVRYEELNGMIGRFASSYRVVRMHDNYYWFIGSYDAGLFRFKSSNECELIDVVPYSLFDYHTVDDNVNLSLIDSTHVLFALENGIAIYTLGHSVYSISSAQVSFSKIVSSSNQGENARYLPIQVGHDIPAIKYARNSVAFDLSYPNYGQLNNCRYRYMLEGLDKGWSAPTSNPQKVYNRLSPGSYQLKVQVLDTQNSILSQTFYPFKVEFPYYWTFSARVLYLILLLGVVYLFYLYVTRRVERNHAKFLAQQTEEQNREIAKREQQITLLEKEKLANELKQKSKELAVSTMSLIKKNEMLVSLKEEVMSQKQQLGTQYPNKYYDKLIRMIDEHISGNDDWEVFQHSFDRIHENFFKNLHHKYPELTANDLRFCAFLRLNLSSKDIANLMNISLKGVEVSRYRIRKKINLPSNKSLTEFMIEFTA